MLTLTLSDFDNKVLIEYLRKNKIKKTPKAVVVAIGAGILGWSICDSGDTFKKSKALAIALGRAASLADIEVDSDDFDFVYADRIPESLEKLARRMFDRSFLYFKTKE